MRRSTTWLPDHTTRADERPACSSPVRTMHIRLSVRYQNYSGFGSTIKSRKNDAADPEKP